VLQYHIMSREKKSAEETQIAKCDSDLSNKEKKESVDDNEPSRRGGYQIYTSFRCRNASSDDQGKGIRANEL